MSVIRPFVALAGVLAAVVNVSAQSLQQKYAAIVRPKLDRAGLVENVDFHWDALQFHLDTGRLALGGPASGHAVVAVFRGVGELNVTPPNATERQQVQFFRGAPTVHETFTEAVFRFADEQEFLKALNNEVIFHPLAVEGDLGSTLDARAQRLQTMGRWAAIGVLDAQSQGGSRYFSAELGTTDRNIADKFMDWLQGADQKWVIADYDPLAAEPLRVHAWRYKFIPALDRSGLRPEMMNTTPGQDRSLRREGGLDPLASSGGSGFSTYQGFDDTWTQFGNGASVPPWQIDSYQISVERGGKGPVFQTRMQLSLATARTGLLFRLDSGFRVGAASVNGSGTAFLQPALPPWRVDPAQFEGNWLYVSLPRTASAATRLAISLRYIRQTEEGDLSQFTPGNTAWYPLAPFISLPAPVPMTVSFGTSGFVPPPPSAATSRAMGLITGGRGETVHPVRAGELGTLQALTTQPAGPARDPSRRELFVEEALSAWAYMAQTFGLPPRQPVKIMESNVPRGADQVSNIGARVWAIPGEIASIPAMDGFSWPGLVNAAGALYRIDFNPSMGGGATVQTVWLDQVEDLLTPHQIAHQWWGNAVGWKTYHDQWLSEGLANASALLYEEAQFGVPAATETLQLWRKQILSKDRYGHAPNDDGPLWLGRRLDSSIDPLGFETVTLDKGGYVFAMLRRMLEDEKSPQPDARYFAMLREYYGAYNHGEANTAALQAIAEKYMTSAMDVDDNHSLDWFFQEYVRGTLVPHLTFHSNVIPVDAGHWRVTLTVDNPDGWRGLLPIYTFRDETHFDRGELKVAGATVQTEFMVAFAPAKVVANEFEDMLVRLEVAPQT